MDLRALQAPPTEAERNAVDALLGPEARAGDGGVAHPVPLSEAKSLRHRLLPALRALVAAEGWVTPGGLGYVCRRLEVPPAEGWGVATFYAMLPVEKREKAFAWVCDDIACIAAGAERICAETEKEFGAAAAAGGHGVGPRWARANCLGLCDQAPAALVTVAGDRPVERSLGSISIERLRANFPVPSGGAGAADAIPPQMANVPRRLLARVGIADPTSLDDYRKHGGLRALERAKTLGPEAVIAEVTASKLVGRGGAAFPTGRKWEAVAKQPPGPRHVVCNADESEPGTFKDRVLLEHDPFAVLEGMAIAALATGAQQGWLYVRGEYPLAAERIANAIRQLRAAGVLGKGFDVELYRGAGAYICGEETALFNSIEGFRGEPRNKPPFPVQSGLFHQPTAINNVETLAAAVEIVRDGAAAWTATGTEGSPGTKLFCVSGKVARPGVYEVPFGTKLDALIALAGGPDPKKIQAVLLGGAAGVFLGPDELALPLSFEDARKAGATLGSGVVLVLDESVALPPILKRVAAFFRDESCGQCVPCRVGTVRQEELLHRLDEGKPLGSVAQEQALLKELSQAMRDASICGLGQTATSAIESALRRFPLRVMR